jgi:hypothetical protein
MIFKKRHKRDQVEERFQAILDLVRDLDKPEFNRLVEAITLAWQGYEKARKVQTRDEKEVADIEKVAKTADFIEEGEK